jgi:hypothetical protein
MNELCDDALFHLLGFLRLDECTVLQQVSNESRRRADTYLAKALEQLYARAPLCVRLQTSLKEHERVRKDMQTFYPFAQRNQHQIRQTFYAPAAGEAPVQLEFTYRDDNMYDRKTGYGEVYQAGIGIRFHTLISLATLQPLECCNKVSFDSPVPRSFGDFFESLAVYADNPRTLTSKLELCMDTDPDNGVEGNVYMSSGCLAGEEAGDDAKQEEEEEEEDSQSKPHEIKISQVCFDVVGWTQLLPAQLQTSFMRLVVYKAHRDTLAVIEQMLFSIATDLGRVLFESEESSCWYRTIATSDDTRQSLLHALQGVCRLLKESGLGLTAQDQEFRSLVRASLQSMIYALYLHRENPIARIQLDIDRLKRKVSLRNALQARGMNLRQDSKVSDLYIQSDEPAAWQGSPLTLERVVGIMYDAQTLYMCTDYAARVERELRARTIQFDTYYRQQRQLARSYRYDARSGDDDDDDDDDEREEEEEEERIELDDIPAVDDIRAECKLQALRACNPAPYRVAELLQRMGKHKLAR